MDFLKARLHQNVDNEYKVAKIARNIAREQGDNVEFEKQSNILAYLSFLHEAISYPEKFSVVEMHEKEN